MNISGDLQRIFQHRIEVKSVAEAVSHAGRAADHGSFHLASTYYQDALKLSKGVNEKLEIIKNAQEHISGSSRSSYEMALDTMISGIKKGLPEITTKADAKGLYLAAHGIKGFPTGADLSAYATHPFQAFKLRLLSNKAVREIDRFKP